MCLTISIRADGLDDGAQKELSTRFPALHRSVFPPLHRGRGSLSVHGCDLLSDSADWNATAWALTADGRNALLEMMAAVFARLPGEIEVEAVWDGNAPTVDQEVSRTSLLSLVEAGGLGTRTRYLVRRSD
jgi:hypothetical protein